MFYSIRGKLILLEPVDSAYRAAVETSSGVAYEIKTTFTTAQSCPKLHEEVTLYTHFAVREGAVDLFGFGDLEERRCFQMLISVSSVGPKLALAILSSLSPSDLALCVASGDSKTLSSCKGIGVKTAERIVLELKDKVSGVDTKKASAGTMGSAPPVSDRLAEALSALMVLGYTRTEATGALSGESPETSVEELIKSALKRLAKS